MENNNKQELLNILKTNKEMGKSFTKGFTVLNKNIINSIKANISVGKSITGAVMALAKSSAAMTKDMASGFTGMIEAEKKALSYDKTSDTKESLSDKEDIREKKKKSVFTDLPKGMGLFDMGKWAKFAKGMLLSLGSMLLGLITSLTIGLTALITGALAGAAAGLSVGFIKMWTKIFKFIGKSFTKMFPNITKMLSDIFGKGGKFSKFFGGIKAFFTENKAFKFIGDGFAKFGKAIKDFGKTVMKMIDPIIKLFKGIGSGSGSLGKFMKYFKKFFGIFKGFFAKLFFPIQVIISLIEGFMEAGDAIDKSEGMMATFFNAIVGFFGGILDGLIFGMLDLVKDGISWIAGFLGFKDVEKFLDSFSFSDMFNEFLDDIYKWFNLLFSDPLAALGKLWSGLTGAAGGLIDLITFPLKSAISWLLGIFGWDDAAEKAEKFSLSGMVGDAFDKAVEWLKGIFGWDKKSAGDDGFSFGTMIDETFNDVVKWFKGIFGFGGEGNKLDDSKEFSIIDFISESVGKVWKFMKEFFGSIFSFEGIDFGAMLPKFDFDIGNPLKIVGEKLSAMFSGLADFAYDKTLIPNAIGDMFKGVASKVGAWGGDDAGAKVSGRSGGVIPGRLTGEQVPAILHANEIVLAEQSAKLFMQAAQMFAQPAVLKGIKDLAAGNSDIKTQTTDAIMQAGAQGGGDGGTAQMMAALMQQTSTISQTMAQIPGAVQEGASSGAFTGTQTSGFSKLSNPHEQSKK